MKGNRSLLKVVLFCMACITCSPVSCAASSDSKLPELDLKGIFEKFGEMGKTFEFPSADLKFEGLDLPLKFGNSSDTKFGAVLSGLFDKKEQKKDLLSGPCNPNPCQNGGTCSKTGLDSFSCNCVGTNFTGAVCDEEPIHINCTNFDELSETVIAASVEILSECSDSSFPTGPLNLPNLLEVLGDFLIDENENITSITANNLERIGGFIQIQNLPFLTSASFDSLETIGEFLQILDNQGSGDLTVSFKSLRTVGFEGDPSSFVQLNDNGGTAFSASFPSLLTIGSFLQIRDNNAERISVSMPALERIISFLSVTRNTGSVASFTFPSLKSTGGPVNQGQQFTFEDNPGVTSISFDSLETVPDVISIANNDALETFCAPLLGEVGVDFTVTEPALTTLCVSGEINVGGTVSVQGAAQSDVMASNEAELRVVATNTCNTCVRQDSSKKEDSSKKGLFSF